MRKVGDLLAVALPAFRPADAGHVGDRIGTGEIFMVGEAPVHHPEQPVHLVGIAVDRVGDLFRCVDPEVIGLTAHRAEAAHLPEQPLADRHALARGLAAEAPRLGREILQDRARLEHRDRLAVGPVGIDDRRHAVVRRDREKGRVELLARADVDAVQRIGQTALFEHDGDLPSVRSGPVVEVDGFLGLVHPQPGLVTRAQAASGNGFPTATLAAAPNPEAVAAFWQVRILASPRGFRCFGRQIDQAGLGRTVSPSLDERPGTPFMSPSKDGRSRAAA